MGTLLRAPNRLKATDAALTNTDKREFSLPPICRATPPRAKKEKEIMKTGKIVTD